MTSNGEVTADVVYAGFGVTAPELGYDDYKDIRCKRQDCAGRGRNTQYKP